MASDTRNVKLGVCKITFNDVDLGYTKGGVDVEVATTTKKIMVDQFGESEINERVTGRTCKVKVPLAETTLDNMVQILPGATLVEIAGVKATGEIAFSAIPLTDEFVTINGMVWTFKTLASGHGEVTIGATVAIAITNLAAALNASSDPRVRRATYTAAATEMTIEYDYDGVEGNALTLAESGTTMTVTAMSGGVDSKRRVDVTNAVGTSLLDLARRLVLHPTANAVTDLSEDFIIPLAMTPGALTYAYKLDEERIFNVEFTAYPDPVTLKLFSVGNEAAA